MTRLAAVLSLCLAFATGAGAQAETVLPALYDVTGVAANDVLNIRQEPGASSPIAGQLAPQAVGIEVVGLSANGKWGLINSGEATGWASMAFLKRQPRPDWFTLEVGLECSGTEPFWALNIDRLQKTVRLSTPDQDGPTMEIVAAWRGDVWRQVAAVQFSDGESQGLAALRGQQCSDGMSDRSFGLKVDVFLQASPTSLARALQGCCSVVP